MAAAPIVKLNGRLFDKAVNLRLSLVVRLFVNSLAREAQNPRLDVALRNQMYDWFPALAPLRTQRGAELHGTRLHCPGICVNHYYKRGGGSRLTLPESRHLLAVVLANPLFAGATAGPHRTQGDLVSLESESLQEKPYKLLLPSIFAEYDDLGYPIH